MKKDKKGLFKFTLALKKTWVKALRSGRFQQGTEALKAKVKKGNVYCCLGVLAHVAGAKMDYSYDSRYYFEGNSNFLPGRILPSRLQKKLSRMNDGASFAPGSNFKEIADYIQKNVFPSKKKSKN